MIFDIGGDICLSHWTKGMNELTKVASKINKFWGEADYRIVNLENPIIFDERVIDCEKICKSGPNLYMKSEYADFLKELDVDAYTLANNHIGDYGTEGINQTINYLDHIGKKCLGIGKNDDQLVYRISVGNTKIAVISVCENEFGTNKLNDIGSHGYDRAKIQKSVYVEKQKSDVLVVLFHGGNELFPIPSNGLKNRYRDLIDMGADAVVGMHQHCPLGKEVYKNKYIYYGIGNLFFPRNTICMYDTAWNYGYITRLNIERNSIEDVKILPYVFTDDGGFEGFEEKRFFDHIELLSKYIEDEKREKLYDTWAAIIGGGYYKILEKTLMIDAGKGFVLIKNLFSCESLSELMARYCELQYSKKINSVLEGKQELAEIINCDAFLDRNETKPKMAIWGVTDIGLDVLKQNKDRMRAGEIIFIDKDVGKQGFQIGGIMVYDPEYVLNRFVDILEFYICVPKVYHEELKNYLYSVGVRKEQIYVS